MSVTFGIAFAAGLASFFSPCILPLVPAYISYLGGRTAANPDQIDRIIKKDTVIHGIAFIIGFSIVFILLGGAVSIIGWLLYELQYWITKIGGLIVVIFGLHITGIVRVKYFEFDLRPQSDMIKSRGILSSLLMGVFFSAGWSPCVGPVLGTILTLAAMDGSLPRGVILLAVYSLGLGVPFILAALGIGWMISLMGHFKKALRYVETVSGWVMIIVGLLLIFGIFTKLSIIGGIG